MKTLSSPPLHLLTQCAEWVGFYGSSQVALRSLSRKILKQVIPVLISRKKKEKRYKRGNAFMPAALQRVLFKEQKYAYNSEISNVRE